MNGPRTNQFVAPTSFITSISRRLAKIDSRIVFAISSVDAMRSTTSPTRNTASMMPPTLTTSRAFSPPSLTDSMPAGFVPPGPAVSRSVLMSSVNSPFTGITSNEAGSGLYVRFSTSSG